MANCQICSRTPLKGNQVSHSQIKTIKRQKINLQSKKIDGQRMTVCTSCLRSIAKKKAK